ncbi:hypothetical protein GCM10011506_25450 [Marivirga lumbricoides]|uniref:Peptidase C39 domain-containing protein n=1 Tax=Marivirga lumbricoides TaxID=1046115 RepID=A0ABQ1MH46_9BACT|nr:hypothetical protein GCM10011506_25450 [Marivirga lumbricoides]
MVQQKGGSIMHATAERIPTLAQYYSSDLKTLGEQTELGVKYIDSELIAGRPIFVGTDKGNNLKYNADNTTEHYIVIVGKVIKDDKVYYRFYDPGRVSKADGINKDLLLLLGKDHSLKTEKGTIQNVSQVRRNN